MSQRSRIYCEKCTIGSFRLREWVSNRLDSDEVEKGEWLSDDRRDDRIQPEGFAQVIDSKGGSSNGAVELVTPRRKKRQGAEGVQDDEWRI